MGFAFLRENKLFFSLLYGLPLRNNFHDVCPMCIYKMQNTVRVHVLKRILTFNISSSYLRKTGVGIQIQHGGASLPTETVV